MYVADPHVTLFRIQFSLLKFMMIIEKLSIGSQWLGITESFPIILIITASRSTCTWRHRLGRGRHGRSLCYAVLFSGHLHIANVLDSDSLVSLSEEMRYVCIVNNPLLGAFLQGDDQKIRPSPQGMGLELVQPSTNGIRQSLPAGCALQKYPFINVNKAS